MRCPSLVVPVRAMLLLPALATRALGQSSDSQRGVKLFEEHNYPGARSALSSVLAREAGNAIALYYMGRVAMAEDRSGEAVGWFEKAVKVNNRSSEYHRWLANALGEEAQ